MNKPRNYPVTTHNDYEFGYYTYGIDGRFLTSYKVKQTRVFTYWE